MKRKDRFDGRSIAVAVALVVLLFFAAAAVVGFFVFGTGATVAAAESATTTQIKAAHDAVLGVSHNASGAKILSQAFLDGLSADTNADAQRDTVVLPAGNYYLNGNVVLKKNLSVRADVNLCLNGYMMQGIGVGEESDAVNNFKFVYTYSGGDLSIHDCNGSAQTHRYSVLEDATSALNGLWVFKNGGAETISGGVLNGVHIVVNMDGKGGDVSLCTIYGGSIAGNYSRNWMGAALSMNNGGKLIIVGGLISGNVQASRDAVVRGSSNVAIMINGGKISKNVSKQGMTVRCEYGTILYNGGELSNNIVAIKSNQYSGGLYCANGLNVSGAPVIRDNKDPSGALCNVKLSSTSAKINISGKLEDASGKVANIYVTPLRSEATGQPPFPVNYTKNYKMYNVTAEGAIVDPARYFASDSSEYAALVSADGTEMQLWQTNEITDDARRADFLAGSVPSQEPTHTAKYGTPYVKYYTDADCTREITDFASAAAGTYYAKITVDPADNDYVGASKIYSFLVVNHEIANPVIVGYDGTYDGQPHAAVTGKPTATTQNGATAVWTYSSSGEPGSFSEAIPTFRDAAEGGGSYTVYYRIEAEDHLTYEGTFSATIRKRTVVVIADNESMAYGGEIPAIGWHYAGTEEANRFVAGDGIALTVSTDANAASTPGGYATTVIEPDLRNYEVTRLPGVMTVTNATIRDAIVTGYVGVFDGEYHNVVIGSPSAATVGGEVTSWAYSLTGGEGTFLQEVTLRDAPETGETYTLWYKGSALYHDDAVGTFTVTISKLPVAIAVDDARSVYGQTPAGWTWRYADEETNRFFEEDGVSLDFITAANRFSVPGSYSIALEKQTLRNYAVTCEEGTLTVLPAEIGEISIQGYRGVYDGEYHSVVVGSPSAATVGGEATSWTYSLTGEEGAFTTELVLREIPEHADYLYTIWYRVEAEHHVAKTGTFYVRIAKKTYDMGGVRFENKTVVEDGSAKTLALIGDLPSGVTVRYYFDGNLLEEPFSAKEPGNYTVTVRFTIAQPEIYESIPDRIATLTINVGQISGGTNESGEEEIIVGGGEGVKPGTDISIVEKPVDEYKGLAVERRRYTVLQAAEVSLFDGDVPVQPDGALTVRLLISEELRAEENLKVLCIDEDGNAAEVIAVREGNYMVFETSRFSVVYALVKEIPQTALIAGLSIGGVLILGALALAVGLTIRSKRKCARL